MSSPGRTESATMDDVGTIFAADLQEIGFMETEDGQPWNLVIRKYEEELQTDSQKFVHHLRSKDRKTWEKYLFDLLHSRSLDYLFDLWGTAREHMNWVMSTEALGKLVKFLMQGDSDLDKTLHSIQNSFEEETKQKTSKKLVSKLKKSVKPFIKAISNNHKSRLKTSEALRRDLTINVIKAFKQADHGFCLIVGRLENSQKSHVPSVIQLLWTSRHRPTAKNMTEELDFMLGSLGTGGLICILRTMCLLDPDLLARETECNLDLACGTVAFYLSQCANQKGARDPTLMLTSLTLGRIFPFRLPDVSTTCATWFNSV